MPRFVMPTFTNASILFGILLVGIPIVLHLIMRQQPQHMIFPALQFIRQRRDSNQRRLRLRHLILLLLRCAAILFLALALARPVFQSDDLPVGNAPVAAAVVIDTGPRMAYRQQNQTRLDVARENGSWLIDQFPADSELLVIDAATSRTGFDVDPLLRVEQLDITPATRPLVEAIENALTVVSRSEKSQKEIFVFTDLSEAEWNNTRRARLASLLQQYPDISLHLFDVGVVDPRNFRLGEPELSSQVVSTDGTVDLEIEASSTENVVADDNDSERTIEVHLLDADGKPQRRSQDRVRLDGASGARITARLRVPATTGIHHGFVRFARTDNLPADDIRYFTIEAKPAWRVLLAAPAPAGRYTRVLRDALSPFEYRKQGLAQFECDVVPLNELSRRTLSDYQAIWLLDPVPLRGEIWQRLSRYVNGGGSLAIALGRNAGRGEGFNTPVAQELLPAELKRTWNAPDGDLRLAPTNLEHPILARFKPIAASVPWDLNPIMKFWQLGPLDEGTLTVIPFDNDRPAMVEQSIGKGLVLTMMTPLSDSLNDRRAWNHLLAPLRESWPGFVLVVEVANYLIGNSRVELNYLVGDTAELRLSPDASADRFLLTTPTGDVNRVAADPEDHTLQIRDTSLAGHYELRTGGTEGTRLGFSVNLPASATNLNRVPAERFQESLGDLTPSIVRSRDELMRSRKLSSGRGSWEGYPWLLLIVVFVAISEQLVSSFFYRREVIPAETT